MIFATDNVGNFHLEIVHDIDKVKDRVAVAADDDKVRLLEFPVGKLARHGAGNQIIHHDRLARHLETNRTITLVRQARIEKLPAPLPVILGALRLEVRALIVVQAEPFQTVEDSIERLFSVARGVGVFDAQYERAAGMARVEPVEQRGAHTANVEEPGRAGSETDTNIHLAHVSKARPWAASRHPVAGGSFKVQGSGNSTATGTPPLLPALG